MGKDLGRVVVVATKEVAKVPRSSVWLAAGRALGRPHTTLEPNQAPAISLTEADMHHGNSLKPMRLC